MKNQAKVETKMKQTDKTIKCLSLMPETKSIPNQIKVRIIAPPKLGLKKTRKAIKKKYKPEITMCLNLYISTCLIEKYLANRIIKTILAGSKGSSEMSPILYHLFVPLMLGAKKNTPISKAIEIK